MENILNEKEFFGNVREVLTYHLLEKAKDAGLLDDSIAKKIIKELRKVEVVNYAN